MRMYNVLGHEVNGDVTSIINRAAILGFFADAYFLTSAGHRRIFSTLNHVVKVMQRMPAGHRPIRSADDKIFGRCPDDDRQAPQRWLPGHLSVAVGRQ